MALLTAAMCDSVSGVNLLVVVPSIIKTLPQFLLILAVLLVICLVYGGASILLLSLPRWLGFIVYMPVEIYAC
jgi:hypothetical protein